MENIRKTSLESSRRVVVKVGSSVLTQADGLNLNVIRGLSRQLCRLMDTGREVILVSSGAMAAGVRKVGLTRRPDDIPQRQAASAVGQAGLIMEYENAFERYGNKVAQILLTSDSLSNRKRYLNARNTLNTLLSWQVVPIINENDTVTVESIQFGDNDNLAAMITLLMDADILISLTDIDGLYDRDPRVHANALRVSLVTVFKKQIEQYASNIPGALGTGGMASKLKAARKVTMAGTPMIIANGHDSDILESIFAGKDVGTFFVPRQERLASRKCWIGYSLKPEGILLLDQGALQAVAIRGKSLLPSGIISVKGDFGMGAPVEFAGPDGTVAGVGLTNYSAADIRKIMGRKTTDIPSRLGHKPYDEVIHRDNLVVTGECEQEL